MIENIRYLAMQGYLAADPQLVNTGKVLTLIRGLFTVILVIVAIGLIGLARKGKLSELAIALIGIVFLSMIIVKPDIILSIGNSLSGLFS